VRRETFNAPEPLDLRLRLVEGEIHIETHDLPEAVVELQGLNDRGERAAQEARVDLNGRELTVEVDRKVVRISVGRGPEVRATVRLPHASTIEVSTVSADVTAEGQYAQAGVKSISGDVRVASVDGNIEVKSISGDVWTGRAGGRFEANTVSGDIFVGEVGNGARVKTISGDTILDSISEGDVRLQSVSGDIRLGIAPGAGVWMDVKSVSGKTESDLPVGDEPPPGEVRKLEVRANSVSGDIRIGRGSGVTA
jgi:DUF4097 and DUF4098 domain-containing protein YvlB